MKQKKVNLVGTAYWNYFSFFVDLKKSIIVQHYPVVVWLVEVGVVAVGFCLLMASEDIAVLAVEEKKSVDEEVFLICFNFRWRSCLQNGLTLFGIQSRWPNWISWNDIQTFSCNIDRKGHHRRHPYVHVQPSLWQLQLKPSFQAILPKICKG